jgi:hypothetical protein
MSSLTYMTTLYRRTIFLHMLLLEFMVASARALANFWVRHCTTLIYRVEFSGDKGFPSVRVIFCVIAALATITYCS